MISHRRLVYSAGLAATLLLGWLPAIAQTSSAQTTKLGTISGRVVNESGRPLANARVLVRRVGSMNPENTDTMTDGEGKFEVSGLQPVSYLIYAFRQGYAPLLRDLDDPQANIYRVGDSVTLLLTKGGVITGTVTNQASEPMVGVRVRAVMVHTANRLSFPYNVLGFSAVTDDRGIYRIFGLPEATYVVSAGGGGAGVYSNMDPFDVDVPTYAPASTRDTAREFMVRAGAETNGVDIQYRGESGHTVSGSVRGDQPRQFGVILGSANGPQSEVRSFQGPNDKGFIFENVDDGDYYIMALSAGANGEVMLSPAKQIKVRGADVGNIELLVGPLSSVAGRVVLEETKTTECSGKQRPVLTETLISARSNEEHPLRQPLAFLSSSSVGADERGNVLLKNMLPGRYYFRAQHFAKDWYLKSISIVPSETGSSKGGKPIDAARTWTTLKSGDRVSGLTVTLAEGAASLRGRIALRDGETAAEKLYVYLVPSDDDVLRFYAAAVSGEGEVALNNLAPGRYLVFAQAATDESVSPLTRLRAPDESAYRARLRREAETVKAEIELKPCQRWADLKVRVSAN